MYLKCLSYSRIYNQNGHKWPVPTWGWQIYKIFIGNCNLKDLNNGVCWSSNGGGNPSEVYFWHLNGLLILSLRMGNICCNRGFFGSSAIEFFKGQYNLWSNYLVGGLILLNHPQMQSLQLFLSLLFLPLFNQQLHCNELNYFFCLTYLLLFCSRRRANWRKPFSGLIILLILIENFKLFCSDKVRRLILVSQSKGLFEIGLINIVVNNILNLNLMQSCFIGFGLLLWYDWLGHLERLHSFPYYPKKARLRLEVTAGDSLTDIKDPDRGSVNSWVPICILRVVDVRKVSIL